MPALVWHMSFIFTLSDCVCSCLQCDSHRRQQMLQTPTFWRPTPSASCQGLPRNCRGIFKARHPSFRESCRKNLPPFKTFLFSRGATLRPVFNNLGLPPGVTFAPRGELLHPSENSHPFVLPQGWTISNVWKNEGANYQPRADSFLWAVFWQLHTQVAQIFGLLLSTEKVIY
jgi:hypothetical protein